MEKTGKRITIAALGLMWALGTGGAFAADAKKSQEDQITDRVIERLEKSGKFDELFEKALNKRIQRDQEMRAKQGQEQQARAQSSAGLAAPITSADWVYGSASAPVALIVYSDIECPYCKRFDPVARQLVDQSNGQVKMVFRHFPLQMHDPMATFEAKAAECVGEQTGSKGFFEFLEKIFKATQTNGAGVPGGLEEFKKIVAGSGVSDMAKWTACVDNQKVAEKVQKQLEDGQKAGVSGTPGNIIRGPKGSFAAHGALPAQALQEIIDRAK